MGHLAQHILIKKRSWEGGWKVFQVVYEPKGERNGCIFSVFNYWILHIHWRIKTVILQPFSISTFGNKMSFKTTLRFTCFLSAWHWTKCDKARFLTKHIRRDRVPWERDTARTIQGSLVLPSDPNDGVGKTIQRRLFTEWLAISWKHFNLVVMFEWEIQRTLNSVYSSKKNLHNTLFENSILKPPKKLLHYQASKFILSLNTTALF